MAARLGEGAQDVANGADPRSNRQGAALVGAGHGSRQPVSRRVFEEVVTPQFPRVDNGRLCGHGAGSFLDGDFQVDR